MSSEAAWRGEVVSEMAYTQAQAEITERRLRPLYDAIDNGQNKKALQIADKVIKKQEYLYCAKALKAIVCQRIGRQEEGNALIQEVIKACPGDQATLQAATMYFRETGDEQKVVDLYTRASQQYPGNQEILTHLFMAYVRVGNYQKQQQTALSLHKAFPSNGPYYCWRVMSIVMQAHKAKDNALASSMYLPLAEKLMEKYVEDKKLDIEEEVKLYLMIMDKLGKTEKKLEILRGDLGKLFRSKDERNNMELECLLVLEQWDNAVTLLTQMLQQNPDQWSHTEVYISCQIHRHKSAFREAGREGKGEEEGGEEGGREGGGEEGEEEGAGQKEGEGKEEEEEEEEEEEGEERGGELRGGEEGREEGREGERREEEAGEEGREEVEEEQREKEGGREGERREGETAELEKEEEDGEVESEGDTGDRGVKEEENEAERSEEGGEGGEERTESQTSGEAGSSSREEPAGEQNTHYSQPLLECRDFLNSLRDQQCQTHDPTTARPVAFHPLRGPFLGRLELVKQVKANSLQSYVQLAPPSSLLLDYFSKFSTKSCCFDDLKPYLECFPTEEVKKFMSQVEAKVMETPVNFDCPPHEVKANVTILRRQISLMQMQRFCGYHKELSVQKKKELVMMCKQLYKEGMKLSRGLPDTEPKTNDFFAILAVHLLMELHMETQDRSALWQAILLLEYVRSRKSSNAQIMLLLLKLYGHLGVAECISDIFEALNIKHLQMETLGYIPFRYLQASGAFGFANQLYRSALRFYYSCAKETSEYIIQAYKNGMFQKIIEFVNFRDKLSHSLNFACTLVDMNLLETLTSIHSVEKGQQFFSRDWFAGLPCTGPGLQEYCSKLASSKDLTIYDDWTGSSASSTDSVSLTKLENKLAAELEVLWLRVRIMLIQCLKEALSLPEKVTQAQEVGGAWGVAPGGAIVFSERVRELSKSMALMTQHMGMMVLRQKKTFLLPLHASPPCLGLQFLSSSHEHTVLEMLSATERLAVGEATVKGKLEEVVRTLRGTIPEMKGLPSDLQAVVAETVRGKKEDSEVERPTTTEPLNMVPMVRIDLEPYVLFLTVTTYVILLTAVCADIIKPKVQPVKKKKKKKGQKEVAQQMVEHPATKELISFLEELRALLQDGSRPFQPLPSVDRELINLEEEIRHCQPPFEEKNFEQSVYPQVCKAILQSYNMSMEDCQEVVNTKLQFIERIIAQLSIPPSLEVE